ncbi:MAG: DEAD/DEAH box helicase [Vicinamibacterales bacterium]
MRDWRSWFSRGQSSASVISTVIALRDGLEAKSDPDLAAIAARASTLPEVIAVAAVSAHRVLGLRMHEEQLQAALELVAGRVVEMQTGEGKTLAAVPAIVWLARKHQGVHVLTANEYLARRDAEWMREVYERMGLTVAFIDQGMPTAERHAAYRADITYATANEVGFDYLRDGLAFDASELVHRTLSDVTVVIDEADSILIDEARIPLVIAGGSADQSDLPATADVTVRGLLAGRHFATENSGANVVLTAAGVQHVEHALGITNLFDARHLPAHTAVQDALHAHVLLRKDVDYVVHDGAVLSVDEIKGRIVSERRWPAGLQTALECKEGVGIRTQGRVLGSVTVENLVAHYAGSCGMTGTAASQARELREMYGLDVVSIPTHRPMIRIDHADLLFDTTAQKDAAVEQEIRRTHESGRPVLVGTASVEESERLSARLRDLPHHVLNARHEAQEAAIIARAGERGTVTISTNMAGRGVDIVLGDGVAALGGLHVIGTNRHHSRRIDHQLRGRAGRQGDPGSSQFFVSRQDALFTRHAEGDPNADVDQLQRMAEGQNLDARLFLQKYERVIEAQRLSIRERREDALVGDPTRERRITLETLDELWSDYLAATGELRTGTTWTSFAGKDPHTSYIHEIHGMFEQMVASIDEEVSARLGEAGADDGTGRQRGATWTYLTTDEPFGPMTQRFMRELMKRFRRRK